MSLYDRQSRATRLRLRAPVKLEVVHSKVVAIAFLLSDTVNLAMAAVKKSNKTLAIFPLLIIGLEGCSPATLEQENAYEITGVMSDGWLTPDTKVLVKDPEAAKQLTLTLEVPDWLPFDYPVKLQTMMDGHVDKTFEFAQSGTHKIRIPLDKSGTISLKIDKWFVPAELGIGSADERQLAYRLIGSSAEEESGYEITGVTPDGWLTPDAKVLIKDPEAGKHLTLTLEVPGWLPFAYPVKLQTMMDGRVDKTFEFAQSGIHKIGIPLDKAGTIALKIDKWFVPAQLGIGSGDERQLAYRLKTAVIEESSTE